MLECFSLFKNINKFTQIRSGTPTSCLDGVRTLSMCWVVMGHVLLWPFDANLPGYENLGDIVPYFNKDSLIATFSGQVSIAYRVTAVCCSILRMHLLHTILSTLQRILSTLQTMLSTIHTVLSTLYRLPQHFPQQKLFCC